MNSSDNTATAATGCQLAILHHSLNETELHRILKAQNYKVKVSTGTVKSTCIFPQSTAAFMILPASLIMSSNTAHVESEVASNLKKFSQLHHKCYVFVLAGLIGEAEQLILSFLQEQYLSSDLSFLPVHNADECAQCMLSIAKVMCKPLSDVIRDRFQQVHDQFTSEENILTVLGELGVDRQTGIILLDGCGGLAGVAKATRRGELIDYNMSHSLIRSVVKVLNTTSS